MAGEIEATFEGNLGADAVVGIVNGREVTEFTVAVTPRRKVVTAGEPDQYVDKETLWLRVSCWGNLAGRAASLSKGTKVLVTGALTPSIYTSNVNDVPEPRLSLDVIARRVSIVPRIPRPDAAPVPAPVPAFAGPRPSVAVPSGI